jgi:tetratricopeptide (TPR) repeat protein
MPYSPLQLAEACLRTGELTDALAALNQHLTDTPDDDAARRLRAQVFARLRGADDLRQALADLDHITTPTLDDAFWRAIILEQLSDFEGALQVMAAAHQAQPGDERIAERYLILLMRMRDYPRAHELLAAMPRSWNWLQHSGDLAMEEGHLEQAVSDYTTALAHLETQFNLAVDRFAQPIKAGLLSARAGAYATLKRFAEAEADYAAGRELLPDDAMLTFLHALTLVELGDTPRALDLCRAAYQSANAVFKASMRATAQAAHYDRVLAPALSDDYPSD